MVKKSKWAVPERKKAKVRYNNKTDRTVAKFRIAATQYNLRDYGHLEPGMRRENRKYTDLVCCGIFAGFIALMGSLSIYAVNSGNLIGFMAPVDGNNMQCGATPGYEDFKYLYIGSLETTLSDALASAYCVRDCPKASVDADSTHA